MHPSGETSVFDLAAFLEAVREMLGVDVDVVSDRAVGSIADAIRAEAVPL